ncbi:MAG: DegT/DnrJ/EryC1/StrS family aminotransferase [Alphaproteobacteria bacterium]|jgi:dTDP-4-amino-4,6-dideoxygalactose transaminase|nr:DegT/DnrJ/EryC1/StrS family aminotransferase [Alphaproteobacteria bacterium]|tara:strand:- start:543 stop:1655 length:1113 start_codon:yes stop_codon:yes gene_type:complete
MSELKVPFIDLQQRYQEEKEELLSCVERVLESGHLVMTPELGAFEEKVAGYVGIKHCVGLNSGTDALMMALMALGIGRGDEVITTPISFVATIGSIVHVGATPVFADVREDQNIDPAAIEAAITPNTKAIMPVHWTGRIADMDAILDIAKRHDLLVVEDSAQTMGAYYRGRHGGTFGNANAISTHPLKNLNAIGDGGFLLTDDDAVAAKVRLYRNHGLEDRDTCALFGVNSRLDVLNAEVLSFRLDRLKSVIEGRRRNVNLYREFITAEQMYIPPCKDYEENAFVMFITQCDGRDKLQAHLGEKGIQSLIYYGRCLHLHPAAEKFGHKKGDFPVAENQSDRVLALPHHQYLSEDQIAYVAESVNAFYGAA